MDVVNPCAALLSNYEVYKILKETREEQQKIKNNFVKANLRNLNTIAYETLKYFENISPCRFSSDTAIPDFVDSVTQYSLSKSELLQLINLRPSTHVELHAIIEECEERYTETQIASLLDVIRVHLHKNTRPRTTDSVCSYLSPTEDIDLTSPETSGFLLHDNSTLSHEEEVVDTEFTEEPVETARHTEAPRHVETSDHEDKRKRKKKVSILLEEDEEEEVLAHKPRKSKALLVSDEEGEEVDVSNRTTSAVLTCDVLPADKIKSLEEETKVKLKIKNASQKFKKREKKTTRRKPGPKRRVSISDEIDVVNIC